MIVSPASVFGSIRANASKSHLQRALVIAMLSDGKSLLLNCDESADVIAVKNAIIALGAKVEGHETLLIEPSFPISDDTLKINVGESGLALRMLAPVVSLFNNPVLIGGEGSLLNRPLQPLLDVLSEAGISFETDSGKLPLKISGSAKNNHLKIDASFSSQMLTGLLISAPLLQYDTVIHVMDVVSKPYIEMTLDIINDFGVCIEHENFERYFISGNQHYIGREYEIEGDWSGASNFLVAAAISGEITVTGLKSESKQADRNIMNVLKAFGAVVHCGQDSVTVRKNKSLLFIVDATDCPDLFPPLAVLAAAARGTSVINGIQRLVHKESNRLESIMEMINALGGKVQISDAGLIIHGNGKLKGGTVNSHNDHRIVMAAAIASCISENPVQIIGAEAVRKSYPDFFERFLGLC